MRIEAVELREIALPLRFGFETSFGRSERHVCLLVRVLADGLEGWGEVPAGDAPLYNEETVGTAWHVLEAFILPTVVGRVVPHPHDFAAHVAPIRRHHMAKAGLEAALWDLLARREGRPRAALLGGTRARIAAGVSLGIEPEIDRLLERIGSFLQIGYQRIKVKIKPGWDVAVVERIRAAFGDILLQVDANSAYTPDDVDVFRALDEFNLLLIEQPLAEDDLLDHAALQAQLRTPLCLDESITSPAQAGKALRIDACRIINIKAARVSGLTAAVAIHDLCRERDVPVWCGGLLETGVGRAANLALASLPNFTLPADLSASDRYFAEDIIEPPVRLGEGGTIAVPEGPGLGVAVRLDRVDALTRRFATFR
ncbi:MAG: o-succinylbenzoate synthase [Armatimonadetes bacterium]|nr:o-succinylbenzoate synthase [Armatimonadota bacterium]